MISWGGNGRGREERGVDREEKVHGRKRCIESSQIRPPSATRIDENGVLSVFICECYLPN